MTDDPECLCSCQWRGKRCRVHDELLLDLWKHNNNGYGRWGFGMRHRVEKAMGWDDHTERPPVESVQHD